MRNILGGFCVGFGLCRGVMVAAGGAMTLLKVMARMLGIGP